MKNQFQTLLAVMIGLVMSSMATVHAAILGTDVDPIITDVTASITAVTPKALGLLAVTMGVVIGFAVLKKLINKAI